MVELLLQHEPATYQSRLQAIKHVTALRAFGRLSRVWMENGYFAKMSHVIPPPPRLQRLFSPEEGGEMFTRAVARYYDGYRYHGWNFPSLFIRNISVKLINMIGFPKTL